MLKNLKNVFKKENRRNRPVNNSRKSKIKNNRSENNTLSLKLINIIRRIKIRQRLIIAFLLLSVTPLMVLGITSYFTSRKHLSVNIKAYTKQIVSQIGENSSFKIKKYMDISTGYLGNSMIQSTLTGIDEIDSVSLLSFRKQIENFFLTDIQTHPEIAGIIFISSEGSILFAAGEYVNSSLEELNNIFNDSDETAKWIIDSQGNPSYCRRFIDISTADYQGNLYISLKKNAFPSLFNGIRLGEGVDIIMLSSDGETLFLSGLSQNSSSS